MEHNYIDTDYKNVENKIINSKDHNEVIDIIQETFPHWIVGTSKKYSDDYKHFQNNWEFITNKISQSTSQISKPLDVIIVEYIDNSPQHRTINLFTEILTVFGHSVRRKNEFISCEICGDAIPNRKIYNQLKERKIKVPIKWASKCSTC